MLAASLNRAAFERAMDVGEDEVMPVASPVGYPAKRMSVRESVMRKGLKADRRLPFDKLFFDGSFERGLKEENAGVFASALEAVRWAPSAVNKQPWRMILKGDAVHFYKAPDKGFDGKYKYDLQKIDLGIALCHFEEGMKAAGKAVDFFIEDPGAEVPAEWQYIASYRF